MKTSKTDPNPPNTYVAQQHPFVQTPHKTLLALSFPVLLSLVAEPLTGLVDTGFVAILGAAPLAAMGVGTMTLSGIFWAFNFLGIGTQTETAQALGGEDWDRARRMGSLALLMSALLGLLLIGVLWPLTSYLAAIMGATDQVHSLAEAYLRVRLFGAPAVLITITGFGIFRGRQNMHTPLIIAIVVNLLNMVLDPLLIFGFGLLPGLGVAGAAGASVISQWTGALSLLWLIHRHIGLAKNIRLSEVVKLLRIGQDLFVRSGMLTLFLLLATRAATQLGAAQGAAHQAIRQIWILTALFLDAYAVTGQSLVAYFLGARQLGQARRVARFVCLWSFSTGLILSLLMWLGQQIVIGLFVPATAVLAFAPAWRIALLAQPINALAFATDGIHWGTGDFRFLRNVVLAATTTCGLLLLLLENQSLFSLAWIWVITILWALIRAAAGLLRIWPGTAGSPLSRRV
jgi:MATE family multidrug resistance protein